MNRGRGLRAVVSSKNVSLDTHPQESIFAPIPCRRRMLMHMFTQHAFKAMFYVSAFIGMHHGMRRGSVPRFLRTADFGGSQESEVGDPRQSPWRLCDMHASCFMSWPMSMQHGMPRACLWSARERSKVSRAKTGLPRNRWGFWAIVKGPGVPPWVPHEAPPRDPASRCSPMR